MQQLKWFMQTFPNYVQSMRRCSYHYSSNITNLHHLEGDVWSHTMMAYSKAMEYDVGVVIKWAILLHDLGRVYTRKTDPKRKTVLFGSFEGVSVFVALEILNKTNLCEADKVKVLKIISYHYNIIDYIKYNRPNIKTLLEKFRYEEDILYDLALYIRCDILGRIIDKRKKQFYNTKKINQFILYTKSLNIQKKITLKKSNTVYILVGPPCSQKSTWAIENSENSIIINRDLCVETIGQKYNKMNYDDSFELLKKDINIKKEVDNLEIKQKNEAISSLNKNIIIDNPNLKAKVRKQWIELFKNKYNIKVIVFLSSFKDLNICTKNRSKQINKSLSQKGIIGKLKTFQFPLLSEGMDEIEYILI